MTSSKRIILAVFAIIVLAGTFIVLAPKLKKDKTIEPTDSVSRSGAIRDDQGGAGQNIPDIQSVLNGQITKIDLGSVALKTEEGEETTLVIPENNVQFFEEISIEDGITLKEIGLLEIEKNKEVQVQYNPETGNVSFIKVLLEK